MAAHGSKLLHNSWFVAFLCLAFFVVGFGASTGLRSTFAIGGAPAPTPAAPAAARTPPTNPGKPATADDDMVLGKADAPVTMIEFSDFQCPYCRRFWKDTLPEIKKTYIDTGKMKLVYRDYPLPFHPAARVSANAMECAHEQSNDLAWKYHDVLFEQQEAMGQGTVQYGAPELKKWAAMVTGIDTAKFNACLDANKYDDEIAADMKDAATAGITGTPGFWLLGPNNKSQKVSGAGSFSKFDTAIKAVMGE